MDNTTRLTQSLSLTTSLILSGINIGASLLTLPILYTRPTPISTSIFHEYYNRGAVTLVPLAVFSASGSATVAYLYPAQRDLWLAAGAATISQLPWTRFVMWGTNRALIDIAESKALQEKTGEREVVGLLKQWAWMNVVRGSFALVGGLIGLWAVVDGPR